MIASRTAIFADPQELAQRAAGWIAGLIAPAAVPFRLALAGGSTPRLLYGELSRQPIDWSKVEFFWIDERFVPPDHPDSNQRMARETLLSQISGTPHAVHPIPTDTNPDMSATAYEATLKRAYGADRLDPSRPLFDLVLLGLGSDGHFCSLLPGSPVLEEKQRWAAPVTAERPEARVTLTYPSVQSSRIAAFVVTGKDKAEAVKAVRTGDTDLPAARFKPEGLTVWLLDRAAASQL